MPEHTLHNLVNRIVFGRTYGSVDDVLDFAVRYLGVNHRRVFHDYLSAALVGTVVCGSFEGAAPGILHVAVDTACSKNKDLERLLRFITKIRI